jgi:hypothetical protein
MINTIPILTETVERVQRIEVSARKNLREKFQKSHFFAGSILKRAALFMMLIPWDTVKFFDKQFLERPFLWKSNAILSRKWIIDFPTSLSICFWSQNEKTSLNFAG